MKIVFIAFLEFPSVHEITLYDKLYHQSYFSLGVNIMLGSIEAGGTKFVCAVSDLALNIVDKVTIDTQTPDITLKQVLQFFAKHSIKSMGIGCFGPIDINPHSNTYGYITATPKAGWQHFNFVKTIQDHIDVPIAFNTDVNVAAYGEFKLGAAKQTNNSIYLTIGTGIGGGVIIDKKIITGRHHPEMGHIFIKRAVGDDFVGNCPFHHDCLEGLASGPAIEKRWNIKPVHIDDNHQAWQFESYYLSQAIVNYTLTFAPDIIILGGGIMHKPHLLSKIKSTCLTLLNGYFPIDDIEHYLSLPKLGDNAGIMGGLLLAKDLLHK